jgi:hypothetical protein
MCRKGDQPFCLSARGGDEVTLYMLSLFTSSDRARNHLDTCTFTPPRTHTFSQELQPPRPARPPGSSPAASASASSSRARCFGGRGCSSWTRPRARWTPVSRIGFRLVLGFGESPWFPHHATSPFSHTFPPPCPQSTPLKPPLKPQPIKPTHQTHPHPPPPTKPQSPRRRCSRPSTA